MPPLGVTPTCEFCGHYKSIDTGACHPSCNGTVGLYAFQQREYVPTAAHPSYQNSQVYPPVPDVNQPLHSDHLQQPGWTGRGDTLDLVTHCFPMVAQPIQRFPNALPLSGVGHSDSAVGNTASRPVHLPVEYDHPRAQRSATDPGPGASTHALAESNHTEKVMRKRARQNGYSTKCLKNDGFALQKLKEEIQGVLAKMPTMSRPPGFRVGEHPQKRQISEAATQLLRVAEFPAFSPLQVGP